MIGSKNFELQVIFSKRFNILKQSKFSFIEKKDLEGYLVPLPNWLGMTSLSFEYL